MKKHLLHWEKFPNFLIFAFAVVIPPRRRSRDDRGGASSSGRGVPSGLPSIPQRSTYRVNLASDESLPPCKSGIEKGKFGGQWGREDCFIALLSADAARSALAIIAVWSGNGAIEGRIRHNFDAFLENEPIHFLRSISV